MISTVRAQDCVAGMNCMPSESVDVCVTSPPYDIGVKYRTYKDTQPRREYLKWSMLWIDEVFRVLAPNGSFFLNLGGCPKDPFLPHEIIILLREKWKLQNTFHWIKSISIDGNPATHDPTISRGHFKPINSKRFVNDCHEYVFHLTKTGNVPLDRKGVGVPYVDKSNIKRWAHSQGNNLRCRGNTWFMPPAEDDQDARWLALLVDTEGTICVNINNSRPENRSPAHIVSVAISNCDRNLLEIAQDVAGYGDIYECPPPPEHALIQGKRPGFKLVFSSRTASNILSRLYPWFIVKKRQAKVALYLEGLKQNRSVSTARLTDEEISERLKLCDLLKALNHQENCDDSWVPEPELTVPPTNILFVPYKTIHDRKSQRDHPATFPVALPAMCLRLHSSAASTIRVMDPFVGLGSSLVAAQQYGAQSFTGFDIDEFYVQTTLSKIELL